MVRDELTAETRAALPPEVLVRAWQRIIVTSDVALNAFDRRLTS